MGFTEVKSTYHLRPSSRSSGPRRLGVRLFPKDTPRIAVLADRAASLQAFVFADTRTDHPNRLQSNQPFLREMRSFGHHCLRAPSWRLPFEPILRTKPSSTPSRDTACNVPNRRAALSPTSVLVQHD